MGTNIKAEAICVNCDMPAVPGELRCAECEEWESQRWRCRSYGSGQECMNDGDEQFSMGAYAGRYCDKCWNKYEGPKYRDFIDPSVRFDPADAGEAYEEDDY